MEDARVAVNRDGGPNGTYELIIKKVQSGDAGSYTAVASNSFGSEESIAAVTVKGTWGKNLKKFHIKKLIKNKMELWFPWGSKTWAKWVHDQAETMVKFHLYRCQGCLCPPEGQGKEGRPWRGANVHLVQVRPGIRP